jgi:hypothetical protein
MAEMTPGISFDQYIVGLGYSYWAIGLSALVSQPLALAFGKRLVYVSHMAAAAIINVWTAYIDSNGSWIARSLLLGFATGPIFILVEVSLTDIVGLALSMYLELNLASISFTSAPYP